jgi:class 3 adenylate cyclase
LDSFDQRGSATEEPRKPGILARLRLRFADPELESAFRADFFRHNLGNFRVALIGGMLLLLVFGLTLHGHILALADKRVDLIMRYGVFFPLLLVGLALSFTPWFERIWEWVSVVIAAAILLLWVFYSSQVLTLPAEYGYVGLILITAFTYAVLRLRFVLVMLLTVIGTAAYLAYAFPVAYLADVKKLLAFLYLTTFGALGGLAAYRIEAFTRVLFLRERQLDRERQRSDSLLLNILPRAIVDRLKAPHDGGRIAERLDEVSVVFADAVGSTEQAARCTAEEFADTLDRLFRRFDEIADRHGLEKIKTIGDAYMAVAGAPVPMADHAPSAADLAFDMVAGAETIRWPSGDPVVVRVGVATGPAVAGVIGQRKFAYDLWGDTVNLASRLQEGSEPGRILVSETTAERLAGGYEFGPPLVLDLKGKGLTPARFLVARQSAEAARTLTS